MIHVNEKGDYSLAAKKFCYWIDISEKPFTVLYELFNHSLTMKRCNKCFMSDNWKLKMTLKDCYEEHIKAFDSIEEIDLYPD